MMASYAAELTVEERWAVVAYIRALQLSQGTPAAELPPTSGAAGGAARAGARRRTPPPHSTRRSRELARNANADRLVAEDRAVPRRQRWMTIGGAVGVLLRADHGARRGG